MQTSNLMADNPSTSCDNIQHGMTALLRVRRATFRQRLSISVILIHAWFTLTPVAYAGAYFDSFSAQTPPALPVGWAATAGWSTTNVVALLDNDRRVGGNVLRCTMQDVWLMLPDFTQQGVWPSHFSADTKIRTAAQPPCVSPVPMVLFTTTSPSRLAWAG